MLNETERALVTQIETILDNLSQNTKEKILLGVCDVFGIDPRWLCNRARYVD